MDQWLAPFRLSGDFRASVDERVERFKRDEREAHKAVKAAERKARESPDNDEGPVIGLRVVEEGLSRLEMPDDEQEDFEEGLFRICLRAETTEYRANPIDLSPDECRAIENIEVARRLALPLYGEDSLQVHLTRIGENLLPLGRALISTSRAMRGRCRSDGGSLVGTRYFSGLARARRYLLRACDGFIGQATPLVWWRFRSVGSLDWDGGLIDDIEVLIRLFDTELPALAWEDPDWHGEFRLKADLPGRLQALGESVLAWCGSEEQQALSETRRVGREAESADEITSAKRAEVRAPLERGGGERAGTGMAKPPVPESAGYALTPDHEATLSALCKRPDQCFTALDISGLTRDDGRAIHRESVASLLVYLAAKRLAHQPHKQKKGWTATTLGMEWYRGRAAHKSTA